MDLKLVPYGAGWTDVYFNIGNDKLYFIISSVDGDQFSNLLEVLYYIHPNQKDPIVNGAIEYCKVDCNKEHTTVIRNIPYKAELFWDEEGSSSHWVFTREMTEDEDCELQIDICINRNEKNNYFYNVRYKDFCYAVAKACTEVLKSHGIYGYHHSTYVDDINLRHLLFIKAVALDCLEIRNLKDNGEGEGESTSFENELELLLFDM